MEVGINCCFPAKHSAVAASCRRTRWANRGVVICIRHRPTSDVQRFLEDSCTWKWTRSLYVRLSLGEPVLKYLFPAWRDVEIFFYSWLELPTVWRHPWFIRRLCNYDFDNNMLFDLLSQSCYWYLRIKKMIMRDIFKHVYLRQANFFVAITMARQSGRN